jgi:hypothetical protein
MLKSMSAAFAILATVTLHARANAVEITTNEHYISQASHSNLPLDNVDTMFREVFTKLSDAVTVYPTENYYYFKIFTNGGEVWGNFRLDSLERDDGVISFAYFFVNPNQSEAFYGVDRHTWHKNFGEKDGVLVKKLAPLIYTVSLGAKTVTFKLNNVKQEVPKGMTLLKDEVLAARICDESGFYFLLVFNERLNSFHYLLDESMPLPDRLFPYGKNIFVGRLSEFAFYNEPGTTRRVLFGVRSSNVARNNYFDGPFDQLADNFVNPKTFQQQLERAYPFHKGKVSGRGDFLDDKGLRKPLRISVSPYITYKEMPALWSHIAQCQSQFTDQAALTGCIANANQQTYVSAKEPSGQGAAGSRKDTSSH